MASDERTALITSIHASSLRFVVVVTGGGVGAIARLLEVPGGSRTLLEARVPYSAAALNDFLQAAPESYCSSSTARAMAMAAFWRARQLDPSAEQAAGFSCTASLASDRPKRGGHRAYLAAQSNTRTAVWSIELQKDQRSREQEDQLVSDIVLNLIAEFAGVEQAWPLSLLPNEKIESQSIEAPAEWRELLVGKRKRSAILGDAQDSLRVVLPGAFNPVHHGHRRMAELAANKLGARCHFELSITNVDKPSLDFLEIQRRVRQFGPEESVVLTSAPTFVEKAKILPGVTFVVGADTIERVAAVRYYPSEQAMHAAIGAIARQGCRFLVFGRSVSGKFATLDEMNLPGALRVICEQVPREEFDEPISSTELRKAEKTVAADTSP